MLQASGALQLLQLLQPQGSGELRGHSRFWPRSWERKKKHKMYRLGAQEAAVPDGLRDNCSAGRAARLCGASWARSPAPESVRRAQSRAGEERSYK